MNLKLNLEQKQVKYFFNSLKQETKLNEVYG